MTDHGLRTRTAGLMATVLAGKMPRLALAGTLLSLVACNRVEPQKTGDDTNAASSAAVADGTSADLLAAEDSKGSKPVTADVDSLSPQTAAGSRDNSQILPPIGQAVTSTNATQGASSAARPLVSSEASPPSAGSSDRANQAGVHIEMTTPSLPNGGADTSSQKVNEAISKQVSEREFMKLAIPESNRPADLLQFFGQCDKAIQDLTITAHTQQMGDNEFHEHAKRLSQMKLDASERMLSLSGLTSEQQKLGTSARVESLSHLTSLGDVAAATKLQTLAEELSKSSDRQLAHQGKLVLLGFRLNQLLEGQVKDPQTLLTDMSGLFETQDDRGLVEMMALQRCAEVLSQLGYSDESKKVLDLIVKEYRNVPDPELSMRAWALETNGSPAMIAFNEAVQATLSGSEKDTARVARASSELLQAFPSVNTLWHVTRLLIPLEFSGNVPAASEVAKVVGNARSQLPSGPLSPEIDNFLDCHQRRLAIRGKPLELKELASFDGRPFDWASYRGKVVLVCFWASWEFNSLEEIKRLTTLRQQIPSKDFEILAINLDDTNMSGAEQMVREANYPWTTVRSNNPAASGFATTVAKELGVNAVPFVLLVDREGRVAAIHARGEKTVDMITELLSKG